MACTSLYLYLGASSPYFFRGHPASLHTFADLSKTPHDMIPILANKGPNDIFHAHESSDTNLILWDESRARKDMVPMAKDPVCGMAVEREKARTEFV